MPVTNAQIQQNIENLTTLLSKSVDDLKSSQSKMNDEMTKKMDDISGKLDVMNKRLDEQDERIQNMGEQIGELEAKVDNSHETLANRLKKLEEKVEPLVNIPQNIQQLEEVVEERTNRQLRETLIFKNIPEQSANETWDATKDLLVDIISTNCENIDADKARNEINRCHREKPLKEDRNGVLPTRAGKRHIFAKFHNWSVCQTIIETFRQKCIADRNFKISVEQMYGPLTRKRQSKALEVRKRLKEQGVISGGYIDFPAKLFVNRVGNVDINGKKIYTFEADFSRHDVS